MKTVHYDTATPYIASYVLLRKGNKVAFVLRKNTDWMNDYYGLPSGKVEEDESFTEAAIREAKEEAGVTIAPEDLHMCLTMHRNAQGDSDWVDAFFEVKTWSGEPYNAEPDVHAELAWLDLAALPKNVISSVRAALEAIAKGETYLEYGWHEEVSQSS